MVTKMLKVPVNAITAEQARQPGREEIESTLTKVFDEISQMSKSEWGVVNNRVSFTIPGKYYNNDEIIDEIVELFKQLGYVMNYEKVSADYSACPPIQAHVWFRVLW